MGNKNTKAIKLTLSAAEDRIITERAKACGRSKQAFIKEMALSGQIISSIPEAKIRSLQAEIFFLAEEVKDATISNLLKERGEAIWQSLK